MHFYGWDWEKIMRTPLKLFWTLLKNMYRIQAQENLRWMQILSMPNVSDSSRQEYVAAQISTIGVIQLSEARDQDGVNKLKALGG